MLAPLLIISAIALIGWYAWQTNKDEVTDKKSNPPAAQSENGDRQSQLAPEETANWTLVATQGKRFSIKVPDGWRVTNYPDNFLGSAEVVYKPGTPASIELSNTEYMGHSLRFRASITPLDDAGLGPQWASPQPGLEESSQNFSIDTLQGKRFKGVFSQDSGQTIYEYVFDLGNGKKLDIVYTVYRDEGEEDDVTTVEKAIKTIQLIN